MAKERLRIGVVAPSCRTQPEVASQVQAVADSIYGHRAPEIVFHPQCYLSSGHFAGTDEERAAAFLEVANDEAYDALWCARGGYGSCRIADLVLPRLTASARRKAYLGYSDAGSLLAGLYAHGFERVAHGPMPQDIRRTGGEAAVARSLAWLVDRSPEAVEPGLLPGRPHAAFNIMILSQLLGTSLQPDLSGHVLLLEEVGEYMYRIDRALFHITSNLEVRKAAGLRLGRCSLIPDNDPDFGQTEEEVARFWCERSGIQWLGRADVGHDIHNKVVPFGLWSPEG